jgi:hypothetical protein
MLVDKAQAFAFARRQQPHSDLGDVSVRAHRLTVNDGLTLASTLSRKASAVKVVRQPEPFPLKMAILRGQEGLSTISDDPVHPDRLEQTDRDRV